jgi:RimJ/RimL family protein N-acetyltransferase
VRRPIELETPRLRLRRWRDADRAPFAALNADPAVMEFFPALQSRDASDASIDPGRRSSRARAGATGPSSSSRSGEFIGFVGLSVPRRAPAVLAVRRGRLAAGAPFWGRGLASEAARAALGAGFERIGLAEIVSFTALANLRSRAVMERIGMRDAHEDFEHPGVPEGHALRMHCLYRIDRPASSAAMQNRSLPILTKRRHEDRRHPAHRRRRCSPRLRRLQLHQGQDRGEARPARALGQGEGDGQHPVWAGVGAIVVGGLLLAFGGRSK